MDCSRRRISVEMAELIAMPLSFPAAVAMVELVAPNQRDAARVAVADFEVEARS